MSWTKMGNPNSACCCTSTQPIAGCGTCNALPLTITIAYGGTPVAGHPTLNLVGTRVYTYGAYPIRQSIGGVPTLTTTNGWYTPAFTYFDSSTGSPQFGRAEIRCLGNVLTHAGLLPLSLGDAVHTCLGDGTIDGTGGATFVLWSYTPNVPPGTYGISGTGVTGFVASGTCAPLAIDYDRLDWNQLTSIQPGPMSG